MSYYQRTWQMVRAISEATTRSPSIAMAPEVLCDGRFEVERARGVITQLLAAVHARDMGLLTETLPLLS